MKLVTFPEHELDDTKTAGLPYKAVGDIHINPEYVGMVRPARDDPSKTEVMILHLGVVVGDNHEVVAALLELRTGK